MVLGEVQPTYGDHKELETRIGKKLALGMDLMSSLIKMIRDMDGP